MGKFTHRGIAIAAVTMAGALCFSPFAFADVIDGDPSVDDEPTNETGSTEVFRLFGPDRIETAVRAAEKVQFNETGTEADTVILANSEVFSDALAATTLADELDAPVLLNTPGGDNLNDAVEDYFEGREVDPTRVIVLGGNDIFNDEFREDLDAESGADSEVIAGANRYETALELAVATEAENEGDIENVFLASGTEFPDALAAGAAASANNGVVLLTKGEDALTQTTFNAINGGDFDGDTIAAIGGPAAEAAENGSPDGDPIETDEDIVGVNRYETAVEVADTYLSSGASEAENLVVTSGENFPDAVVGGAFAANVDGALLLTKQDNLTNVTADFLESETIDADSVFVFGGEGSVSSEVLVEIADIENPAR